MTTTLMLWVGRQDLSPIEHLWDELGGRIYSRSNPRMLQEIENVLSVEWQNIPQQTK